MSRFFAIALSGGVWLAIGIFLLNLGLNLLVGGEGARPLEGVLSSLFGGSNAAAIALIAVALLIGYYKAKAVFTRVVKRTVERVLSLQEPIAFTSIYNFRYLLLILLMMSLGFLMRFFQVPSDIRGFIDVAVGAALINGGVSYLRVAFAVRSEG